MAEAEVAPEEAPQATDNDEGSGQWEACEEGAPLWVVTFGDMMSLLLCFFVLIVSFSTMDVIKYRALVGSLRSAFGSQASVMIQILSGRSAPVGLGDAHPGNRSMTEEELEYELRAAVEEEGLTGEATLHYTDRGLVLRVRGHVLFDPGSAEIRAEAIPLLKKVAAVCRIFPRKVYVEGHTDNTPTRTDRFPSNWELSAARASAVVRYMLEVEHITPERFVASGYAETMPIATNRTAEGRAANRRVEFVFSRGPKEPYED